MSKDIILGNVTEQQTETKEFQDQKIKTLVSQVKVKTGVRNAQLNFAVGFASAPVKSDRLLVTEVGSGLFAVGGATQGIEEELNLAPGERAIFSTDEDGALKTVMKLSNDGSSFMSNDNGSYELKANGTFLVNGGNLEVLP